MGQNKNFIAARLPQELYDRLESTAGDKKGERTQIIVRAIAAYLDFPLTSTDTVAGNNEKFVTLESRIAELEQQLQEFKEFVISKITNDNKTQTPIIITDNTNSFGDNNGQPNIVVDNKHDNKSIVPIQSDGSIGPAPESQIASFMAINRRSLGNHRKKLETTGKPLNQPKRVKYNNKPYDLICQGESKMRGKTSFLWIAQPIIELDNNTYQPDITEYQPDNNLLNAFQKSQQEEQKQAPESSEPNDNLSYPVLSVQPDVDQEEQEENKQGLQSLNSTDNISYQALSAKPNFNKELNIQQQDSDKRLAAECQPELPIEEQPEF